MIKDPNAMYKDQIVVDKDQNAMNLDNLNCINVVDFEDSTLLLEKLAYNCNISYTKIIPMFVKSLQYHCHI